MLIRLTNMKWGSIHELKKLILWDLELINYIFNQCWLPCRFQWSDGHGRGSAAYRLLGLQVRFPPGLSVCCECWVCFQVEVCKADRSLVQRSRTDCSVSNWMWLREPELKVTLTHELWKKITLDGALYIYTSGNYGNVCFSSYIQNVIQNLSVKFYWICKQNYAGRLEWISAFLIWY
jgi:hypothetical protein